jgi:hypothetical protein
MLIMSDFEFEIKIGERLPDDTRMELPDESYEQELVATPIPFENRVEYLSDYVKPAARSMTCAEVAVNLGVDIDTARKLLSDIDAPIVSAEGAAEKKYHPSSLEVIKDELDWRKAYSELNDELSVARIVDFVGRSRDWVVANAYALGVYPKPDRNSSHGPRARVYPKDLVNQLRKLRLHTPPASEHYSITELQEIVKKDHRWIERQLSLHGIVPDNREHLMTGEVGPHYRTDVVDLLLQAVSELPPLAGEWMTAGFLAKSTGLTEHQVKRLLKGVHEGEMRLSDYSRPALHYPPEVETFLNAYVEDSARDEVTYTYEEIAQKVGRSVFWVKAKARPFKDQVIIKPTSDTKINHQFSQEVMDTIASIAKQEPPMGDDWLTIEDISKMLIRHRSWVVRRLAQATIASEVRLDVRMKPRQHYSPSAIDELQYTFMIDEENAEY